MLKILSRAALLIVGVLTLAGARSSVRTGMSGAPEGVLLEADPVFDAAAAARGEAGFASFLSDDLTTIRADQPLVRGETDSLKVGRRSSARRDFLCAGSRNWRGNAERRLAWLLTESYAAFHSK